MRKNRALILIFWVLSAWPGLSRPLAASPVDLDDPHAHEIHYLDDSETYSPIYKNLAKALDPQKELLHVLRVYQYLAWEAMLTDAVPREALDSVMHAARRSYPREWALIAALQRTAAILGNNRDGPRYEQMIADVRAFNDPESTAYALTYYAYHLLDAKRFDEAYRLITEAMELIKSVPDPSLAVFEKVKTGQVLALGYQEKRDESTAMHLELDAFYEKYGIRARRAFNLYNLGFTYRNRGGDEDYVKALQYFEKSIALAREVKAEDVVAINQYALSLVKTHMKKYPEAVDHALKGLEFFNNDSETSWRPYLLSRLGQAYTDTRQYDKALEAFAHAERIFPADSKSTLNELNFYRSRVFKEQGRWQDAFRSLEAFTDEFRKQAAEKEKAEYQRASVALGLQYQEERNAQLKEQVSLLKKFRWMSVTAACLLFVSLCALILVWRQRVVIHRSRQTMKEVLDNIDEGILTFDRSLRVLAGYSPYLEQIFPHESKSLLDQSIHDLLFAEQVNSHESILVRESLAACFGETQLTWDLNAVHLPFEIRLRGRLLHLAWQPLRNEHGLIRNVLLAVRDITEERATEEALRREERRMVTLQEKLAEVLAQDMAAAKRLILDLQTALPELQRSTPALALKRVHGFKGAARVLGLKQLATQLHQLESQAIAEQWDVLQQQLKDYLQLLTASDARREFTTLMDFAALYARELQRLEQAGHAVAGLLIDDEVQWPPELLPDVHEMLLHAVSNAVDHGFLRRDCPRAAKIAIRARRNGPFIEIAVQDNGAGIDTARLRQKAQTMGLRAPTNLHDLLFLSGFSTVDRTTETSGRGVGLGAIRSIAAGRQGKVALDTVVEGGTLLTITLPYAPSVAA